MLPYVFVSDEPTTDAGARAEGSPMSLIAVIQLAHPKLALTPTIRSCRDAEIHVIQQSGTDPETGKFFFFVEGADDELEATLDGDPTVSGWTRISGPGDDDSCVYRMDHTESAKLITPRTTEIGGLTMESWSNGRGWNVRLQLPDREALSELWEFCEEEEISFELLRMFRQDEWTRGEPAKLTAAQRDALVTAHQAGYFEEPREASLSDVAKSLGISPTAVGGRIRRGTAELVETVLLDDVG